MEEVAWGYHWPPSEIHRLKVSELVRWHEGLVRIHKALGRN